MKHRHERVQEYEEGFHLILSSISPVTALYYRAQKKTRNIQVTRHNKWREFLKIVEYTDNYISNTV